MTELTGDEAVDLMREINLATHTAGDGPRVH
jgi:hypothetical protein